MISVEQAIQIVQNSVEPAQRFEKVELSKATGYILSENIISPINMPPFRQSAMDGYAVNLHDASTYTLIGEVKAGDGHHPTLKKGEAVRIFTGAPVPDSANAVIIQEKVKITQDNLLSETEALLNHNIRSLGEQLRKGQIALTKGTLLNPAAIGLIATLGIPTVEVYSRPTIAIIATGNELIEVGQDLAFGQIYESNTCMLTSALHQLGFEKVSHFKVDDNFINTLDLLEQVVSDHDITLVSGGISVGDYDFVGKALEELQVEELFYKVKQKPGKPLFFGKKEKNIVFALPGNPAAALSCFYIYVYTALQIMSGLLSFSLPRVNAQSVADFIKKGDRAQFLKAIYLDGKVEILDGQSSSMLHTFALANALVYLPETANSIKKDDRVEVIILPLN